MLDPKIQRKIDEWLQGPFDPELQEELRRLLQKDPHLLADAFSTDLSFGTGGMRGIMGVGTNRINTYTIARATQGLAQYIKKHLPSPHSVFIGYDVRHNSRLFAETAAHVLAGNGITPLLSETICPTPLASFACRHFHCSAAIMITASHNPPEYNGYKVYGPDGGQIVPPCDLGIIQEAAQIKTPTQISHAPTYRSIGAELDTLYLAQLKTLQLLPPLPLKILYTNLHGTGLRLVPKALASWGYNDLSLVQPQTSLDGSFPNAPSPNPEEPEALSLGAHLLSQTKSDLLLATDPDADRIGAVILHQGAPTPITGNQTASLLLHHLASTLSSQNRLPPSPAFIKTIVTTELFAKIARHFGGALFDLLTGFKYIGALIETWEKETDPPYHFIFGAEESYGCLFGTFVRDKDAISASCLIAQMAAHAKQQNKTLLDLLHHLYRQFGIHREKTISLSFPSTEQGMRKREALMQRLRKDPPAAIGGAKIRLREDYLTQLSFDGERSIPLTLPKSDVLRFWLDDNTKFVIRPSGTEPKIKLYVEVEGAVGSRPIEEAIREVDARLEKAVSDFKKISLES